MFSWFQRNDSPVVNPKQRLLGSAENALMQASQKHQGYLKFGEVLHLQGPYISLEALSTAIKHLQHRHPVLRSRLQLNPAIPNSYLLEEDDTLQLKIREISRKRADHLTFWQEEWRRREKDVAVIGQGLVEFWLLQDPDDNNDNNSPREIAIISEHSISDGLSLSTVAHELLIALVGDNNNMFINSLNWPMTMEAAIQGSVSLISRLTMLGRFFLEMMYIRATNRYTIARLPVGKVDFPLTDMANHCHTVACYGTLNKEETQKLIEKCRREGVTVTSAVSSALLHAASTLVNREENQQTALHFSIGADTRRRCIPSIPNHDLTYHVSGLMSFIIPTNDIPTTSEGMWQLAKMFGHHMKTSLDAGQVLALGLIIGKIYQKVLGPPNFAELPTCGISSWGVLPFQEQYGQWKLEGMTPFTNMIQGGLPFATIQSVNGVLTIMFGGSDPVIALNLLENFRDYTMQKLHQMIEE